MAVSSKSGNTKLVADALQRELSYAGVRFATFIDLDDADAEPAQSEGVESAKSAEGVENGQGANADASVPAASVPATSVPAASTIATQASEADVVFVAFGATRLMQPRCSAFSSGPCGKARFFLFGTCGFGESDEYFAQILERVRAYLPVDAQYIGGAMCQGRWVWA